MQERDQVLISVELHGRVAFLPLGPKVLKTRKPMLNRDPPQTLGEHLRKRRHKLDIFQKDAARELSANQWTLIGWEADRKKPTVRFMSRIIHFLGYDPFPEPCTLGGRLLATRRRPGLSQE